MIRVYYITQTNLALSRAHVNNILNTSSHLSQLADVRVTVVARSKLTKSKEQIFTEKNIDPVEIINLEVGHWPFLKYLISRRKHFHVLYFRDTKLFFLAWIFRYVFRKKVVFEIHRLAEKFRERPLWWASVRTAHGIVSISQALLNHLSLSTEMPTVIAHCGIADYQVFDRHQSKEELREQLGLPKDNFLLGYIGQFPPYNFKPLFQALTKIQNLPIKLFMVGGTPKDLPDIVNQISQFHLQDRVIVRQRVPYSQASFYMSAADCLLVPDGGVGPGDLPTKCYEYMPARRPIICETGESTPEVMHHLENAYMIDAREAEDWEKAIREIYTNKKLANKLAERAFLDGRQYNWDNKTKSIASLLRKIVK